MCRGLQLPVQPVGGQLPDEITEMGHLVAAGSCSGALGVTTSRTTLHKTKSGDDTPDSGAAREELVDEDDDAD